MFRRTVHEDTAWTWTWKDMVVDMVWNILSISPRVIALALFASYVGDYFWMVLASNVIGLASLHYFLHRDGKTCDCSEIIGWMHLGALVGYGGWLFNFCSSSTTAIHFRYYLLYWLVMFIENTVLISLWWFWSSDLHLSVADPGAAKGAMAPLCPR